MPHDDTAPLGRRIAAGLLDLLLVIGLFTAMAAAFGETSSGDGNFNVALNGLPALAFFVLALAYYGVSELVAGRTVGKALLGLRVVRDDGARLRPRDAIIRTALRIVDGLFFYLVAIACILATGERRQRIGDLAAGTRVVRG